MGRPRKKKPVSERAEISGALWSQVTSYWRTQREAAEWLGVQQSVLSRRVTGGVQAGSLELGALYLLAAAMIGKSEEEIRTIVERAEALKRTS